MLLLKILSGLGLAAGLAIKSVSCWGSALDTAGTVVLIGAVVGFVASGRKRPAPSETAVVEGLPKGEGAGADAQTGEEGDWEDRGDDGAAPADGDDRRA